MANPIELRGSVQTIRDFDKMMLEGKAFKMSQSNAGATLYFQFTVPADKYIMVNRVVFASAAAQSCYLLEDPTKTTGTTAVTPVNLNRALSTTASVLTSTFSDPTGISAGTEVLRVSGIGGLYEVPLLLKPESTYILAATTATLLQMYWVEAA